MQGKESERERGRERKRGQREKRERERERRGRKRALPPLIRYSDYRTEQRTVCAKDILALFDLSKPMRVDMIAESA